MSLSILADNAKLMLIYCFKSQVHSSASLKIIGTVLLSPISHISLTQLDLNTFNLRQMTKKVKRVERGQTSITKPALSRQSSENSEDLLTLLSQDVTILNPIPTTLEPVYPNEIEH
ncbi:hypothetical protein BpHYR1_012403 [Brachionus plicatilis]|uniref:Uncharacterized protein n=1 Tax=Brachionus plicatilis TaxID=10195 RepID=A0A3M7R0F6_BRAPC|nr:hypothetical protein BpHYR1_012403 [Brachionus plicatilis]